MVSPGSTVREQRVHAHAGCSISDASRATETSTSAARKNHWPPIGNYLIDRGLLPSGNCRRMDSDVVRQVLRRGRRLEPCKDGETRKVKIPASLLAALRAHREDMALEGRVTDGRPRASFTPLTSPSARVGPRCRASTRSYGTRAYTSCCSGRTLLQSLRVSPRHLYRSVRSTRLAPRAPYGRRSPTWLPSR